MQHANNIPHKCLLKSTQQQSASNDMIVLASFAAELQPMLFAQPLKLNVSLCLQPPVPALQPCCCAVLLCPF